MFRLNQIRPQNKSLTFSTRYKSLPLQQTQHLRFYASLDTQKPGKSTEYDVRKYNKPYPDMPEKNPLDPHDLIDLIIAGKHPEAKIVDGILKTTNDGIREILVESKIVKEKHEPGKPTQYVHQPEEGEHKEGLKDKVMSAYETGVHEIKEKVEDLKQKTIHFTEEYIPKETLDKVTEKVSEVKEKVINLADKAIPGGTESLGKIKDTVTDTLKGVVSGVTHMDMGNKQTAENVKEQVGQMKDKAKDMKDQVTEKAVDMKDQMKNRAGDMKDQMKDKAVDMKDQMKNKAGGMKDQMKDKAVDMKDRAVDTKDQIKDKATDMKDQMKDKAFDMKDQIKDKAVDMKDQLKEKAVDVKDQIKEKAFEMKDKIKDKAVDVKDQVVQKAKDLKDEVMGKANETKDQVKSRKDEFVDKANEVKDQAKEVTEQSMEHLKERAHNAKDYTKDKAKELQHEFAHKGMQSKEEKEREREREKSRRFGPVTPPPSSTEGPRDPDRVATSFRKEGYRYSGRVDAAPENAIRHPEEILLPLMAAIAGGAMFGWWLWSSPAADRDVASDHHDAPMKKT